MISKVRNRIAGSDENGKRVIGALIILFTCFIFATSNYTVKLLSARYDGMFISFFRFFAGVVFTVAVLKGTGRGFVMNNKKALFLRGIFGAASMILMYIGIKMTSNGRATLLSGTSPVFVAVFGYFIFNERIKIYNIIAIVLGVAGAVVVFYDGAGYSMLGNIVCLASGICGGFTVNYTRISRQSNNSLMVYLYPCVFGVLITFSHVQDMVKIASVRDFCLLLFVGGMSFTGQVLSAFAYKYIEATPGRVFGMAEIIFSILLGYFFAAERVTPQFVGGLVIIVSGVLINLYGLSRRKKRIPSQL